MLEFFSLVMDQVDNRTKRFLSISIVTVALLHIVVEHKLFMESDLTPGSNGRIVCKGSKWKHEDHIPRSKNSMIFPTPTPAPSGSRHRPSTIDEENEISVSAMIEENESE